ncbi:unnamed protein product [Amoebophrya sp. A25]|nr:unnamed protein product [Amoebophrya sp. A25]|eukprot:GSA25T00016065001.1
MSKSTDAASPRQFGSSRSSRVTPLACPPDNVIGVAQAEAAEHHDTAPSPVSHSPLARNLLETKSVVIRPDPGRRASLELEVQGRAIAGPAKRFSLTGASTDRRGSATIAFPITTSTSEEATNYEVLPQAKDSRSRGGVVPTTSKEITEASTSSETRSAEVKPPIVADAVLAAVLGRKQTEQTFSEESNTDSEVEHNPVITALPRRASRDVAASILDSAVAPEGEATSADSSDLPRLLDHHTIFESGAAPDAPKDAAASDDPKGRGRAAARRESFNRGSVTQGRPGTAGGGPTGSQLLAAPTVQRPRRRSNPNLRTSLPDSTSAARDDEDEAGGGFVYHSPCGEKTEAMKLLEQRSQNNGSRRPSLVPSQNASRRPSLVPSQNGSRRPSLVPTPNLSSPRVASDVDDHTHAPVHLIKGGALTSMDTAGGGALNVNPEAMEARFEQFRADADRLRKKLDALQQG